MNDRTAELEDIDRLIQLPNGPRRRKAHQSAREAFASSLQKRGHEMSDWFVFSRDPHGRDTKSRKLPNEEAAVALAGDLMLQKYEIIRIEGPNAQVIEKREIERKVGLTA